MASWWKNRRGQGRLVGLGTAVAVVVSGASAAAEVPSGDGGRPAPASAAEPDAGVRFLMGRYGISAAEADRRMALQDKVTRLQDELDTRLGRAYGGLWLDQAGGGVATVGVRPGQADLVRTLAARAGIDAVRTVPVGRSLADLDEARTAVQRAVAASPSARTLSVGGVHVKTNQLVLSSRGGDAAPLQRKFPGLLRVQRQTGTMRLTTCADAASWFCYPPLRGGVGLTTRLPDGSLIYCTAGFNARSRSDRKPYVLTAGHCSKLDYQGRTYQTRFPNGEIHDVGPQWGSRAYDDRTDALIVKVNNPSPTTGWNPKPWVLVTNSANTTYQESYTIGADGGTTTGIVVCSTNRFSGSQCGEVLDSDAVVPAPSPVDHAALVSGGCIVDGDSGGPVSRTTSPTASSTAASTRAGTSARCTGTTRHPGGGERPQRRRHHRVEPVTVPAPGLEPGPGTDGASETVSGRTTRRHCPCSARWSRARS